MHPPADPFDALHPDNIPAWADHQGELAWACNYDPRHSYSEWEAARVDSMGYPDDVGHDRDSGRQQVPVSFHQWMVVRGHPCWPEYVQQMHDLPAGEAIGFGPWLHGLPSPGRPATLRPTRPFLCSPHEQLPAGWVRGDRESTDVDRPARQVAYDPRRHLVVRQLGEVSPATREGMAAAGYQPLTGEPGVTYFVRDRSANSRAARQPATAGTGRSQ